MKHLLDYIFEALSDEAIKKLNDAGVNNDNVDDIIKILKKHTNKQLDDTTVEKYKNFFIKHGIWELNWGRKNTATKAFVNLFDEYDHLNVLADIVENDGVVSINDVKETGNIFKDYCENFDEEAKTIASWTNSRSANAGPCELLLKFIIKEANSSKSGDVTIHKDEEMEVKASTLSGNTSGSGGHAAGQKGKIKNTAAIYQYINTNLFDIETDINEAEKLRYFQNKDGVKEFNDIISDKGLSIEEVTRGIVDALCNQYNKGDLNTIEELYNSAIKLAKKISKDGKFNSSPELFNLVGCIQLYLYSIVEEFDYFFAVLVDKNVDNESDKNGLYFCVKNCKDKDSGLLDFDKVLSYIKFGGLDSTTSSQGRTGKIYIKKG